MDSNLRPEHFGRWGDAFEAIALLRRGTARVPQVPALWSYLGQFLSDSGAYDEAIDAFQRSARNHGGNEDGARYNVAIVFGRQKRYAEALQEVRSVGDRGLPREVVQQAEAWFLLKLDRPKEAMEILGPLRQGEGPFVLALLAHGAEMLGDREAALQDARHAIRLDKTQFDATEVLRRLTGRKSEAARLYLVCVEGEWHEGPPMGFFAWYEVIAESESDLLEFIRPFEPDHVQRLRIESAEAKSVMPGETTGVRQAKPGYTYFRLRR